MNVISALTKNGQQVFLSYCVKLITPVSRLPMERYLSEIGNRLEAEPLAVRGLLPNA
jgi:predicted transcriptional regulator with HTH domain